MAGTASRRREVGQLQVLHNRAVLVAPVDGAQVHAYSQWQVGLPLEWASFAHNFKTEKTRRGTI